jgi:hypothetical protein
LRLLMHVAIVLITTLIRMMLAVRSVVYVLIWLISPARRSSLSGWTFRP